MQCLIRKETKVGVGGNSRPSGGSAVKHRSKLNMAGGYIIFAFIFTLFIVGWVLIVTSERYRPVHKSK